MSKYDNDSSRDQRSMLAQLDLTTIPYQKKDVSNKNMDIPYSEEDGDEDYAEHHMNIMIEGTEYQVTLYRYSNAVSHSETYGLVFDYEDDSETSASVEIFKGEQEDTTAPGVVNESSLKSMGSVLLEILIRTLDGYHKKTGRPVTDSEYNAGEVPQEVWNKIFIPLLEKHGYVQQNDKIHWEKKWK